MENICYIIGAGDVDTASYKAEKDDFIICADGGYKYKDILGRECNLVIGDFDSLGSVPDTENKIVVPCEKDDTDMALAVFEGMKRGYKTFVIFGGLGGDRFDHSIANIQLLNNIASRDCTGFLVQGERIFTCIKNSSVTFDESCDGYLSVFSLSDISKGVTLRNLKYELENGVLYNNKVLGASNEFTGKKAFVSVEEGSLLLYWNGRDILRSF